MSLILQLLYICYTIFRIIRKSI